MIHALAAPEGSDDFVTIATRPASDADVKAISFTVRSESKLSSASAVFTEITIRARELESSAVAEANAKPIPNLPRFGKGDLATVVNWNFQGARPASIREVGNAKSDKLKSVTGGTRVIHPANFDQGFESVGVRWNGELAGDFEITLNYRDFQSKPVLLDWRVPRVDVNFSILAETDLKTPANIPGLSYRHDVDGNFRFVGTVAVRQPDGTFTYPTYDAKVDQSDSGRLRILRQGNTLSFQAAAANSEDWKQIGRHLVDPGPVRTIAFGLRCEDQEASAEVVLTELTIRAKDVRKK
jgi:hypothetical protein